MPKWRSARARARSGVMWTAWRTPSSTTKSLPAPCILVKFQIMEGLSPITWGRGRGAEMRRAARVAYAFCSAAQAGGPAKAGCGRGSIIFCLTQRARFKASMDPVILAGAAAHPAFDVQIQAGGCLFERTFAGEIRQGRHDFDMIFAGVGVPKVDHRQHGRVPFAG